MFERRILVVDDEKAILRLFEAAFEKAGYEVLTAENAEEALQIIENNDVQVMFLDLNMPGMDGIELCREIKARSPISIIFAITGYATLFELSDCLESGFADYFKKPLNLKTLMKATQDGFEKIERWKST